MTETTTGHDEPTPGNRPPDEASAGPWLVVLAGVALLLALFIVLALIAARAG